MIRVEQEIREIAEYKECWDVLKEPLEMCRKAYPEETKILEELFENAICWKWFKTLANGLKAAVWEDNGIRLLDRLICETESSAKEIMNYSAEGLTE